MRNQPVHERGGGGLGLPPVAFEHRRPAHQQLARLALRHVPAVRSDDPDLDARQRPADRSRPPLAVVRVADRHQRLGHPVALEDRVAELRAEGLEHGCRQRRRAGHEEPHPPADPPRGRVAQLEEADVHRRHAEEERGPELLEEGLGLVVLEALDEPHPAPAREPGADTVAEAMDVEERQHGEVAVLGGDPPGLDQRARVRREVPVGEHGALGPAGGAGRVDDGRGPVIPRTPSAGSGPSSRGARGSEPGPEGSAVPPGLPRELVHVPHGRPGGNEPREVGRRHHGHGLRIAHDVADLALAVEDVDRHEDHAELQARQEQVEELGPVGELDGEAVAGTEPRATRERAPSGSTAPRPGRRSGSRPAHPAARARARARSPRPASEASKRSSRGPRVTRQG